MDKQVLSEINRSREIMGLGQLLREQKVTSDQIKIWFASDGAQSSSYIKNMVSALQKNGFDTITIDGDTVWSALNKVFEKIIGQPIIGRDGEGTKAAFSGKIWKYNKKNNKLFQPSRKCCGTSRPLQLLGDGTLRVISQELQLTKENPVNLTELTDMINTFNVKYAGKEQLVWPGRGQDYEKFGNANRIISKPWKDDLFLWSIQTSEGVRDVTKDQELRGDDVAGEVLNAPLSDSYDNLVINIKDTSKVDDIKAQMENHVEQGGTVDSVTITSTASNTGLDPKKMSDFSVMMTKAGFSEYSNVSTTAGGEMEFTMEDKIDTTDKALAVVRGKLLARLLGVEDKANYKFAVTSGAKVVNVSVKGTSPATPGETTKIQGKVTDEVTTTDKATTSEVIPTVLGIHMKKQNWMKRFANFVGTGVGAQKKKKA